METLTSCLAGDCCCVCYVNSDSARGRLDTEQAAEPHLRQIIDVLQQVMCKHDAEKLAISALEIHGGGYREERRSK